MTFRKLITNKHLLLSSIFVFILSIIWLVSYVHKLNTQTLNFWTLQDNQIDLKLSKYSDNRELLASEKFIGNFIAKHNNLGQIVFWFDTLNSPNDDILVFRIKEKGAPNWHFENAYSTKEFQTNIPFSFSFPVLTNSQNKQYYFELESIRGATGSAIYVSSSHETPVSRYNFNLTEFIKHQKFIPSFAISKASQYILDPQLYRPIIAIILIFIFYILFSLRNSHHTAVTAALFLFAYDLFKIPVAGSSIFPFTIFFLWLSIMIRYRLPSSIFLNFALVLLPFVPFYIAGEKFLQAEKIAIWIFLLFLLSGLQAVISLHRRSLKITTQQFLLDLINRWYLYSSIAIKVILGKSKLSTKLTSGDQEFSIPVKTTINIIEKILELSFRYGPHLIFILLLAKVIKKNFDYFTFYQQFFLTKQFELYWSETGKYLLILYFVLLCVFAIIQYQKTIKTKLILGSAILLLSLALSFKVFNHTTSYKYDVIIWDITPQQATLWDEVKITGRNFRNLPFIGKVYVNGVEHAIISWTQNEIIFQADPTKTKTGDVKIIDYYGKESNVGYIEYYDLQTGELIK